MKHQTHNTKKPIALSILSLKRELQCHTMWWPFHSLLIIQFENSFPELGGWRVLLQMVWIMPTLVEFEFKITNIVIPPAKVVVSHHIFQMQLICRTWSNLKTCYYFLEKKLFMSLANVEQSSCFNMNWADFRTPNSSKVKNK